ncbi:low-temperature-induced 65 kDa protein-like [Solanum stenotomum]|uniref:low-temperature-induced 65 kDa protein-like n=1 Tax=Solanum stenotomum TaxID=172797 RepID=UPI0020D00971|nr:low-temperature-induced 65 kDa protein-like [Solanum stenotomum]
MEAQQYRANEKYEDELVVEGNKVGLKTALEDDPNAPKQDKSASNYQTKVTDPTGANSEEVGTTPLVESFEKMSVKEEIKPEKGASMKNYLAEKFKPRDEDKALSEVISGKLAGRKDKTKGAEQAKPTEKVKEKLTEKMEKPEGVATQKGSTDEQRAATAAAATTHVEGAGKSMINRLKGVASSWLNKAPAAAPPSQQTPTSTTHGT